jgi:hypothetical protein|tara:strand:- start:4 stop:189 length:186 start_codon:yes stop_codon:yes gene_type:complete
MSKQKALEIVLTLAKAGADSNEVMSRMPEWKCGAIDEALEIVGEQVKWHDPLMQCVAEEDE